MTRLAWIAADPETEQPFAAAPTDAFAAWKACRSARSYAVEVTSDALAPPLRRGWFAIAEPGPAPSRGDLACITFASGQVLILEIVQRSQLWITACAPLGKRVSRQFAASNVSAVDLVVGLVPPAAWPACASAQEASR